MKIIKSDLLKNYGIIAVILILAIFVRFYNFSDRVLFGAEQAISLLVSGDYIKEKVTLIGDPNIQRITTHGQMLFHSPVFNYSLIPVMILLNYDPLKITAYFALLNVLTGLLVFWIGRKFWDNITGLFAAVLFLFDAFMINHSMFIWIQNFVPILNALILYIFLEIKKQNKKNISRKVLLIGLISSLSFGTQYFYAFTIVLIFGAVLYFAENKIKQSIFFITGFTIGYLPTIIYNLRHEFYDVIVLWQYTQDTFINPKQNLLSYYHFLQFWPLMAIVGGVILSRIYKFSKAAAVILTLGIVFINLSSNRVSFDKPTGSYSYMNYPKLEKAARTIAADNPSDFNLVMTFDFDSRAYPLRYLLKYRYGFTPLGIEDYPKSRNLYVFTQADYPILNTSLWEISSFNAGESKILSTMDNLALYKLTKSD